MKLKTLKNKVLRAARPNLKKKAHKSCVDLCHPRGWSGSMSRARSKKCYRKCERKALNALERNLSKRLSKALRGALR